MVWSLAYSPFLAFLVQRYSERPWQPPGHESVGDRLTKLHRQRDQDLSAAERRKNPPKTHRSFEVLDYHQWSPQKAISTSDRSSGPWFQPCISSRRSLWRHYTKHDLPQVWSPLCGPGVGGTTAPETGRYHHSSPPRWESLIQKRTGNDTRVPGDTNHVATNCKDCMTLLTYA